VLNATLEASVGRVSLNRSEQRIFDYWSAQPDERQFWIGKVQKIGREEVDDFAAALRLEPELWSYYVERSSVVPHFRAAAARESLKRTSMRNLAELLLRLWSTPRPKQRRDSLAGDS
jgi:hypothetical protein